ncbi:MAG: 16S rRNA pseudouridine(516) synthase, partial [Clostridia bacterium]|nr:16S rRNA pseudouridine(516) synthase [Clostridia bacterium]
SKPCSVCMPDPEHGEFTVTEGKYHQIKRMFHAVGSEILALERITFAGLTLDPALARGEWRELTEDEVALLMKHA